MTRSPAFTALKCAIPAALSLLVACGTTDDSELTGGNNLPTTTEDDSDASSGDSADSQSDGETSSDDSADTGNPPMGVPSTYRFSCIDIQQAGSADDASIQANLLQDNWGSDVANFKLNIMVDFLTLDEDSGDASMQIRSGIGTADGNLCSEPASDSAVLPVTFDSTSTLWTADNDAGRCAQAAGDGATSFGSFNLMTGPTDVVYIYAEDDDGQSFNCTDSDTPDAVPIRAVQAEFTLSEDESVAYGSLTGCLVESEAEELCSCLGACVPPAEPYPNCQCNPDATPLRDLLLGVQPTDNCTEIMGETAFDMTLAFTAERLPIIPEVCG